VCPQVQARCKPCMHGERCVKFGCMYSHPASRRADCRLGFRCKDASCKFLHPRRNRSAIGATSTGADSNAEIGGGAGGTFDSANDSANTSTAASPSSFRVGQRVLARFLPNSSRWSTAVVRRKLGDTLTLHFDGYDDVNDVPVHRVRAGATESKTNETNEYTDECKTSEAGESKADTPIRPFVTSGAAVAAIGNTSVPSSPSIPPGFEVESMTLPPPGVSMRQLEARKRAAVSLENYATAARIKVQMAELKKKIAGLETQKRVAAQVEDFLRAATLKAEIAALRGDDGALSAPTTNAVATAPALSCGRQARSAKQPQFSLFSSRSSFSWT